MQNIHITDNLKKKTHEITKPHLYSLRVWCLHKSKFLNLLPLLSLTKRLRVQRKNNDWTSLSLLLDDGGIDVGDGGVGSAGASNILGDCCCWMDGCCWTIRGCWTTTPTIGAYCKFWSNIWERLVNWFAMAVCTVRRYCSFSILCCSTMAWSWCLVSFLCLVRAWFNISWMQS